MATRTNDTLRCWLDSDAVRMLTDGALLTRRREWSATYPAEPRECRRRHARRRLGEIDRIHVTATLTEDDSELTLTAHTVTRLTEPPTALERAQVQMTSRFAPWLTSTTSGSPELGIPSFEAASLQVSRVISTSARAPSGFPSRASRR